MKNKLKFVMFAAVILQFLCLPAFADWKAKIVRNQVKAAEYIMQMKNGAHPDNVTRPTIRYDEKYKAKKANQEIREAMTEAERLARAGKNHLIKNPDFKHRLVSEERYDQLKKELE